VHLANPRNAWRSLTRWRTSWLSREALCALVLLPLAAAYAAGLYYGVADARLLAFVLVPLAWTLLFCTAMIYASLKPIRQWHTPRVPLGYFVLGHASGALAVLAVVGADAAVAPVLAVTAVALLFVGLVTRIEYWRFVRGAEGSVTLERAIGVAQGVRPPGPASVMAARLLDAGHSRGTFLTREFVARASPARVASARAVAVVAGFVMPAALVVLEPELAWLAFGACLLGLVAERWLFFVEARHTVRLYHGDGRT
jgi:DMSO reductase anchor subunit